MQDRKSLSGKITSSQPLAGKIAAVVILILIAAFFLFARLPVEIIAQQQQALRQVAAPSIDLHAPLPDFTQIHNIPERKEAFFQFLLPRIQHANQEILEARERILTLRHQIRQSSLSTEDALWLVLVAEHYRVPAENGFDGEFFNTLLRRVDIIPPSLVLAQAATESGWGTSRFAREGNNLFGEYCYVPGCGIVPSRRNPGARHEVARFKSPYDALLGYMTNLNRHDSYLSFRRHREQARQQTQSMKGERLAEGLIRYSERGQAYIRQIQSMIRHNSLARFDDPQVADTWISQTNTN